MKGMRIYVIAVCALALSAGSLLLNAAPGSTAASDRDVVVTNTSANPVPVVTQGTTNIEGFVNVSKLPSVDIATMPAVQLVNSEKNPLLVRDVDNPARNAFQSYVNFSIPDGELSECATLVNVPSGKRLVIEYVSEDWLQRAGLFDPPSAGSVLLATTLNGLRLEHSLSYQHSSPHNSSVAQQVRLYADQNVPVDICVSRLTTSGFNFGYAVISGYFVDMP